MRYILWDNNCSVPPRFHMTPFTALPPPPPSPEHNNAEAAAAPCHTALSDLQWLLSRGRPLVWILQVGTAPLGILSWNLLLLRLIWGHFLPDCATFLAGSGFISRTCRVAEQRGVVVQLRISDVFSAYWSENSSEYWWRPEYKMAVDPSLYSRLGVTAGDHMVMLTQGTFWRNKFMFCHWNRSEPYGTLMSTLKGLLWLPDLGLNLLLVKLPSTKMKGYTW